MTTSFRRITRPEQVKYAADLDPLLPGDERYVPLDEIRLDHVPRDLYRALKSAVAHPRGKTQRREVG